MNTTVLEKLTGRGDRKMLNLTKHQEELLGEFKHPLLSHVFTV